MKKITILSLPIIIFTLISCNPTPGIASPASVFCIENNGNSEIRSDSNGNKIGICTFNLNGKKSECEEWAYFRGECKPQ